MIRILLGENAAHLAPVTVTIRRIAFLRATHLRSKNCDKFVFSLNNVNIMVQQRRYVKRSTKLDFRNITENTLADTPSGYIQDPANHPKQMVTYRKIAPEEHALLEEMEIEYDLMHREELAYNGYTTIAIQKWKEIVLKSNSTPEELESACTHLQETLNEMQNMIGYTVKKKTSTRLLQSSVLQGEKDTTDEHLNDVVVISENDCNHVRYIIVLAMRRLQDYEKAEKICMEILSSDHSNCDALESLIELYTGTEQPRRLCELFDKIQTWDNEEETESNRTENTVKPSNKERNGNGSHMLEVAMVLLSDMIVEAGSLHYMENGEGSTSRFFLEAIFPIIRTIGSQYTSLFLESVFRSMDEQHFAARLESSSENASEQTVGVVISFLKTLLARNLYELVRDPVRFEFHILSKLHSALRYVGRKHESYKICERLIKLYREKSGKYELPSGRRKQEIEQGFLDDLEPAYRLALFQFVEDRAMDSVIVGKRLCIQAVEEFPEEASPWETLALLIHKEDPIKGLDDAVVAAKKAFSLDPKNLSVVLLLANFYKAQKRYQLYDTMMDRYRLLNYIIESGVSDEDMKATLDEIENLDELNPREMEPDDFSVQFAELREHNDRMDMVNSYSMPIDKEPRTFGNQPVSAPILDPAINADKPNRLRDAGDIPH
ncbi:hypothetical protein BCY84_02395 [Trypanosoma cruzi cruzi]|uniref:Uncharacterized protein n=1 Tax=Trypanosoma cruzi TaxID=5693 RepID=A0A2V2UKE3_TRYCR|nr:hypothetical protein BCY84_02395 [Trypanosoma cruzi cruzi]PWU84521.1 hypothetical protein C4B63_221g21 [Trypanosoma cruzi]